MQTTMIRPEVETLIARRDWAGLRDALSDWPAPDIADLLMDLKKGERVLLFRALPRERGRHVIARLRPEDRINLIRELTDEETQRILADLHPDNRTALLSELPGQVTQHLLNLLPPEKLEEARTLLGYPEDSTARLMTPHYVAVQPDWTVDRALEHVRQKGRDSETINRIYVVDENWVLLDDVELRRFILADPGSTVESIMDHGFASVQASADREDAVRVIQRYDQVAIPVVDTEGVLLGIVTVDDLLDVAEEEATEDFHKLGSTLPLGTSLRDAPFHFLYRRRIGWLMVLVFMNIFSGAGIAFFEETIEAYVALVFFLPLLIDSGGNAGSQSATLMVRALATGDVRMRDWFKLLGREVGVALALGLSMAAAVALVASLRAPEVLAVVALTMTIVVMVGSLVGMLLPFILTKLKLDPATASAPLITSIADICGVLIYFSIATWMLGIGG